MTRSLEREIDELASHPGWELGGLGVRSQSRRASDALGIDVYRTLGGRVYGSGLLVRVGRRRIEVLEVEGFLKRAWKTMEADAGVYQTVRHLLRQNSDHPLVLTWRQYAYITGHPLDDPE
jgi:hypothetical protein